MQEFVGQSQSDSLWNNQEVSVKKFAEKSINLEVYQFQVSGKTPKYINNAKGTIYKQYTQAQNQFYELISAISENDEKSGLKRFVPEYFGVVDDQSIDKEGKVEMEEGKKEGCQRNIWIQHISSRSKIQDEGSQKFIIIKNLTFGYNVQNIIDLKLGIKRPKTTNVKFQATTTNTHKFRINGMMVGLTAGTVNEQCFVSKYHGQKITRSQTESYLSLFFYNGVAINTKLIGLILHQLDQLLSALRKFSGVKFISSSLFIAYDGRRPQNYAVKLIDFDKYEHTEEKEDANIIEGLTNISKFLTSILANSEPHLQKLKNRELEVFKHASQVIPQSVRDKYNHL